MAVKVLITRQFKQDGVDRAHQLLKEIRSTVTLRPGYISGQTLISGDTPNKTVVVSTWTGRNQWDEWQADPKRKDFAKKLEPLLESPEQIEVFLTGTES